MFAIGFMSMTIAGEFWQRSKKGSRDLFIILAREMSERTSRLSTLCWTLWENPEPCLTSSKIVRVTTVATRLIRRWLKRNSIGGHLNRGSQDLRRRLTGISRTLRGSNEREAALIRTTIKTNMALRCVRLENSDSRCRWYGWACTN